MESDSRDFQYEDPVLKEDGLPQTLVSPERDIRETEVIDVVVREAESAQEGDVMEINAPGDMAQVKSEYEPETALMNEVDPTVTDG